MKAYLAGPMRGYERFNFPAFDEAARRLRGKGWTIVSPAEHDRAEGFNENEELGDFDLASAIMWDLEQICTLDAVILLPGWESSSGVKVEKALAEFLRKRVLMYEGIGKEAFLLIPEEDYVAV